MVIKGYAHAVRLSRYLPFAVSELLRTDLSLLTQPTDYDSSWAAYLVEENGSPSYPDVLPTLLERQHPDGGWGSRVSHSHDRLLTTLAVVLLLARFGNRRRDKERQAVGEHYIWRVARELDHDGQATVGFELLLPALLERGKRMGSNLPYAHLRRYETARAKKLNLLPSERIFQSTTTALFSLEAFVDDIDLNDATSLLQQDGSMASSPSATAALLGQAADWRVRFPRSTGYLEDLLGRYDGGLPAMAPCGIFARAWVLHYLQHGRLLSGYESLLRPHYRYLREHLAAGGVGFSPHVFPDADDTAVTLFVLHNAGYDVDGSCLLQYERDDHFAVYPGELDPSISANLHILEALETLPAVVRQRTREKVIGYVLGARQPGGYWEDKWHASVYYPTSQAVMALLPHAPGRMEVTLDWLLSTQHTDGSWGQYGPTVEETALSLLALLSYYRANRCVAQERLRLAARYLIANEMPFKDDYPELWIAKALYAPTFVIRSIVLAALGLYLDTFGDKGL
jgi:halimadienyl-diphosphate synthase